VLVCASGFPFVADTVLGLDLISAPPPWCVAEGSGWLLTGIVGLPLQLVERFVQTGVGCCG